MAELTRQSYTLTSPADGLQISVLAVAPAEGERRGLVLMAHGMAEHKERYIPLMEYLASRGFCCVMNDHRGHGGSVKDKSDWGYMGEGGARALVDDMLLTLRDAQERFPGLPAYMFGHSMGSLAVRCFTKEYGDLLSGLIVCGSPSNNPAAGVAKGLCRVIGLFRGQHHRPASINNMAFAAYGKAFTDSDDPFRWLSVNKENVKKYGEDEACGYCFTVNGFIGLFDLIKMCYSKKGWNTVNPDMPVRFIAGENDPCIVSEKDFDAAVSLMREVGYKNVTSRLFPGYRHEIFNEGDESVWQDIGDTLEGWRKD